MRPSTLLSLLPVVAASPALKRSELAPLIIPRDISAVRPGKYMVALKNGSSGSALNDVMELFPGNATHVYESLFKGFAATLDEASLKALRDHPDVCFIPGPRCPYSYLSFSKEQKTNVESLQVDFIEPDQNVPGSAFEPPNPAPSAHAPVFRRQSSNFDKYYNDPNAGEGVCAYVVDTDSLEDWCPVAHSHASCILNLPSAITSGVEKHFPTPISPPLLTWWYRISGQLLSSTKAAISEPLTGRILIIDHGRVPRGPWLQCGLVPPQERSIWI